MNPDVAPLAHGTGAMLPLTVPVPARTEATPEPDPVPDPTSDHAQPTDPLE